jgi:cholesterol oxidase
VSSGPHYDYDWIVIGSGFGGSVSALRLAEKGYRVAVLECGRRFRDADFAKTTWELGRYYWMPRLGLKGIFRLTPFKDVFIASGCGVGGGSLGYANTLYRARPAFFENPQWAGLGKWEERLAPHYATAERMLGVAPVEFESDGDRLMQDLGRHFGVEDTYTHTSVGVFFGEPGREVEDPYFGGTGPRRTGCIRCGACMIGCRHGAKNTLVKNYLWLAERRGAEVHAERTVTEVRPLGRADGADGYAVSHERSGAWWRKDAKRLTARGVVVAAGALGTNQLLAGCKHGGALPRLSERLGELVRTNSESILAVTVPEGGPDFTRSVAISSSIYPSPETHIEFVTNGPGGDSQSLLYTLLTGEGTRVTRPLRWAAAVIRHPLRMLRGIWPFGWSRRTVVLLVMQALDNAIAFRARRKWLGRGVRLVTEQDPEKPNPTFIPVANEAASFLARRLGGIALSSTMEALFNVPATAHILGGAVIGSDASHGVIDVRSRVFGYENLLVCDGAAVPANPGVNPSLTITALAEHAMSFVPEAPATNGASR